MSQWRCIRSFVFYIRILEIHSSITFLLHALTSCAEIVHMTFYCTTDQVRVSLGPLVIHNFLHFSLTCFYILSWTFCLWVCLTVLQIKTKKRRSDPVLWQKPLHQQKCQKGNVTTQTTPQKSSIKQQLRIDLGRSVGVTTDTQLVWLTLFTGPPSHSPQQPCNQKDTHT